MKFNEKIKEVTGAINEEYVETIMDEKADDALFAIEDAWQRWKNGPATEYSDLKPAKKELIEYITTYLRKYLK
jgi:hypothetical protein